MITKDDVRRILADKRIFAVAPEDLGEHTELALDSLSLVWLIHKLEEEHGIVLDPQGDDFAEFTSVDRIHSYIARHVPSPAAETV